MSETPLVFIWTGDAMKPRMGRNAKEADKRYVIGERYSFVEWKDRSLASHGHQFAAIHEAWQNLPDHLQERFPTSTILRKHALIMTGWADCEEYAAKTPDEAERVGTLMQRGDTYSIVTVSGLTVTKLTAKSQSMRAMGKADFQRSKTDVLDYCAALIGIGTRQLQENAGQAA